MELDWDDLIARLPGMCRKLDESMPLLVGGDLSCLPASGVYVLYENGKVMYTGKAMQIGVCVKGHCSSGATVCSLTWALVREEARRQNIKTDGKKWREFEILTGIRYDNHRKYSYGKRKEGISESWLSIRNEHEQNKQFKEWYKLVKAAKQRVKRMEVRVVGIQDECEKDMFLIYTCMKLKAVLSDYNLKM